MIYSGDLLDYIDQQSVVLREYFTSARLRFSSPIQNLHVCRTHSFYSSSSSCLK